MLVLTEDYVEGHLAKNPLTEEECIALNTVYDKMKWMFE